MRVATLGSSASSSSADSPRDALGLRASPRSWCRIAFVHSAAWSIGCDALQARALLGDLDVGERLAEVQPLALELRARDREPAEHAVLARGAGDGEGAVERRVAVLEALAQQRRGGDVDRALQPRGDRRVLDPREAVDRTVEQRRGGRGVARPLGAERAEALGAGAQRVLPGGVGRRARPSRASAAASPA